MSRTTLIRHVTDDIRDRKKNTIHSAYASGKTFTGITLSGAGADLNRYWSPGVVRIANDIAGTKPPISNCAGYLVIMTPDPDREPDGINLRQILYPDSLTEPSPYTRIGTLPTVAGNDIDWGEWTTLGGGMTHRKMIADTEALPNMMYYSFGNHTLTLLDPSSFSLGTKIGLIQFAGTGSIVHGDLIETTSADYAVEDLDTPIGGLVYLFEICADSQGQQEWVLENDNNVDGAINGVLTYVTATRDALAVEVAEREALSSVVATKQKQVLYYSVSDERLVTAEEVKAADIHLFCIADSVVYLPSRKVLSTVHNEGESGEYSTVHAGYSGARVIIEVSPGVATLVVENNVAGNTSIVTNSFVENTDNIAIEGTVYYSKSENVYVPATTEVDEVISDKSYYVIDEAGVEGKTIVGGSGEFQTFAASPGVSLVVELQFSAVGGSWEWVRYTAE